MIIRRLDRLGRASSGHQRDIAVLTESFAVFVRMWFTVVPQTAEADKLAAQRFGGRRYHQFVDLVSKQLATGAGLADRESGCQVAGNPRARRGGTGQR